MKGKICMKKIIKVQMLFVSKLLRFVPLYSLDADVWKKFLSRPGLPFILRLLRGLATQHPPTQVRSVNTCKSVCKHKNENRWL